MGTVHLLRSVQWLIHSETEDTITLIPADQIGHFYNNAKHLGFLLTNGNLRLGTDTYLTLPKQDWSVLHDTFHVAYAN